MKFLAYSRMKKTHVDIMLDGRYLFTIHHAYVAPMKKEDLQQIYQAAIRRDHSLKKKKFTMCFD